MLGGRSSLRRSIPRRAAPRPAVPTARGLAASRIARKAADSAKAPWWAACAAGAAAAGAAGAAALADGATGKDPAQFAGQWCATVTEFGDDGNATTKNIGRYARHLAAEGCVGVFVCGTSGESMSLNVEERMAQAAAWKSAGDREGLRVIVHVGCDATGDALALARHAGSLGVAGVSCMAPRFFKCASADALADYCAGVAAAAGSTPFLYYHFPMATNVPTPPSAFFKAARAKIPTLAGMKFSDGNMWEYGDCCDADAAGDLAFLPGFEAQTLAYLPYHPQATYGAISLSFSVAAPLHQRVADAHYAGDAAAAHALQAQSRHFFREIGAFGWTQAIKFSLYEKGVFDSPLCRAPSKNLDARQRADLKRVFRDLGAADPANFGGLL